MARPQKDPNKDVEELLGISTIERLVQLAAFSRTIDLRVYILDRVILARPRVVTQYIMRSGDDDSGPLDQNPYFEPVNSLFLRERLTYNFMSGQAGLVYAPAVHSRKEASNLLNIEPVIVMNIPEDKRTITVSEELTDVYLTWVRDLYSSITMVPDGIYRWAMATTCSASVLIGALMTKQNHPHSIVMDPECFDWARDAVEGMLTLTAVNALQTESPGKKKAGVITEQEVAEKIERRKADPSARISQARRERILKHLKKQTTTRTAGEIAKGAREKVPDTRELLKELAAHNIVEEVVEGQWQLTDSFRRSRKWRKPKAIRVVDIVKGIDHPDEKQSSSDVPEPNAQSRE